MSDTKDMLYNMVMLVHTSSTLRTGLYSQKIISTELWGRTTNSGPTFNKRSSSRIWLTSGICFYRVGYFDFVYIKKIAGHRIFFRILELKKLSATEIFNRRTNVRLFASIFFNRYTESSCFIHVVKIKFYPLIRSFLFYTSITYKIK